MKTSKQLIREYQDNQSGIRGGHISKDIVERWLLERDTKIESLEHDVAAWRSIAKSLKENGTNADDLGLVHWMKALEQYDDATKTIIK